MAKEPRSDTFGRTFVWLVALLGGAALFVGGYVLYRGAGDEQAGPGQDLPGGRDASVVEVEEGWGSPRAYPDDLPAREVPGGTAASPTGPAEGAPGALPPPSAGAVTSLDPLVDEQGAQWVGADVRLDGLEVQRVEGRLLQVGDGQGRDILVLVEDPAVPAVGDGQRIGLVGTLQPVDVLDEAGFGGLVRDADADVFVRASEVVVIG